MASSVRGQTGNWQCLLQTSSIFMFLHILLVLKKKYSTSKIELLAADENN